MNTIALDPKIVLQEGEIYAGIVMKEDVTPSHHLIVLPGEASDKTWAQAKAWAAQQEGDLPTLHEQSAECQFDQLIISL